MSKTLTNGVGGLSTQSTRTVITALQSNATDFCLSTIGLAIHGSASALAKIGTAAKAFVDGVLVAIAAADLPALVGTVLTATFNVYVFYVNSAGTISVAMGTAGATLGAVVFPVIPASSAVIGFIIINPTGTGSFVGGTSALDDATIVPNAVYVNTPFPFNPNSLSL